MNTSVTAQLGSNLAQGVSRSSAIDQLRSAIDDIDISAYNAAKYRIESAIAALDSSVPSGQKRIHGAVERWVKEPEVNAALHRSPGGTIPDTGNAYTEEVTDILESENRRLRALVENARTSIAQADKMLSEHIEKFHDYDYEPHQVCTCHPDDAPVPCPRKFATHYCWRAAVYDETWKALVELKNRDTSAAEQKLLNYLKRVERALDGSL